MLPAILTAVLALLAATACSPHYPAGPAGTVTARDARYFKSGGWYFHLTVNGTRFRVTRDQYRRCSPDSTYPACTHR